LSLEAGLFLQYTRFHSQGDLTVF